MNETQVEIVSVMDGSWSLVVTASDGGVTGRVYTTQSQLGTDDTGADAIVIVEDDIVSFTGCKSNQIVSNVDVRFDEDSANGIRFHPLIYNEEDGVLYPICAQGRLASFCPLPAFLFFIRSFSSTAFVSPTPAPSFISLLFFLFPWTPSLQRFLRK